MIIADIFVSQLTDPFRIGLVATTRTTLARTSVVLPLLAGLVFVAILIPMTFSGGAENWWTLVAVGLLSNAILLAIALGLWLAFTRLTAGKSSH